MFPPEGRGQDCGSIIIIWSLGQALVCSLITDVSKYYLRTPLAFAWVPMHNGRGKGTTDRPGIPRSSAV